MLKDSTIEWQAQFPDLNPIEHLNQKICQQKKIEHN